MNQLSVFTRYPRAGEAKTRLIPAVGAEKAAEIHRAMAEHLFATVDVLRKSLDVHIEVSYHGGDSEMFRAWLGDRYSFGGQVEGDLGRKMEAVFENGFNQGFDKIVVVGTDCPELSADILRDAFRALDENDMILGPACDGGYYCLGLKRLHPALFEDIPWGTDTVLKLTLARAKNLDLGIKLLPELHDVDRPEDLCVWETVRSGARLGPKLSVIIPAYNEEKNIAATIRSARAGSNIEIIVVDGGSTDATVETARSEVGVVVLSSRKSKSAQMNLGAEAATGEHLLFLHADTLLRRNFDGEIRRILRNKDTVAGAFLLKIDGRGWMIRWVEVNVWLRSKLSGLPYGDQGIFLDAEVFRRTGGFPDLPIMEDFVYMRALRKLGRIGISNQSVVTSARRWQSLGVVRTTIVNHLIILGYTLGISPERLCRWYRGSD
ncbi:MAG: DUF2064 domain-containing protein [Proteobacteria bacterium]|nr:DUF2064 domain-containing protein [Pseudomonadota bacterium]